MASREFAPGKGLGQDESTPPESDGALTWDDVAERLAPSRNYWLVTTDIRGGPHAAPVWGAVESGALNCSTSRSTLKTRNLSRDSRALIHLESGDDVVIVRGRMLDVGDPSAWPGVVRALHEKYREPGDAQYLPPLDPDGAPADPGAVMYRLEPESALVWALSDFDGSTRRWPGT